MDGQPAMAGESRVAAELRARLQPRAPDRVGEAVGLILDHAFAVLQKLNPSEVEFEQLLQFLRLCCTNPMKDSSCESSVVAGGHEQTHTPGLQDQELARL